MENELNEMPQSPEIGKTKFWVSDYNWRTNATIRTGVVEGIEEESKGYLIKIGEGMFEHVWQDLTADDKEAAILNWANYIFHIFEQKRDSLLAQ